MYHCMLVKILSCVEQAYSVVTNCCKQSLSPTLPCPQGWMNEIQSYDPEMYHATLTHSVFVRLEGATLRLSRPNRNIARRVTINEPKPDVTYISQKIYDLTDSKVAPGHLKLVT